MYVIFTALAKFLPCWTGGSLNASKWLTNANHITEFLLGSVVYTITKCFRKCKWNNRIMVIPAWLHRLKPFPLMRNYIIGALFTSMIPIGSDNYGANILHCDSDYETIKCHVNFILSPKY